MDLCKYEIGGKETPALSSQALLIASAVLWKSSLSVNEGVEGGGVDESAPISRH